MKLKQLFTTIFILCLAVSIKAQDYNPYKSIGKKAKVLTLSHGKYVEFFDTDSIQRIGTVMFNIRTKKVVRLLNAGQVYKKASDNSSASRWYSPDPLAEKYACLSPYAAMGNNPILFKDVDGRDIIPVTSFKNSSYYSTYQKLISSNTTYGKILSDYQNNKSFNYYLGSQYRNEESHSALASTKVIQGTINKASSGMILGLDVSTNTFSVNETKQMFEGTSKEGTYSLNEIGKAFVLFHEAAHAGLHSIVGDEFQDKMHENIAGEDGNGLSRRSDIQTGLMEYNKQNNLGFTDNQITDLSYLGLQGTKEFDTHFGLDKITDTKEYGNKQLQVITNLLQLIYTEKQK